MGSLYPLMTYSHFGGDGFMAAVAESTFAGGLFAGSLIIMAWGGGKRLALLLAASCVAFGVLAAASGMLAPSMFWVFVVLCAAMGMVCAWFNGPTVTLVQRNVPEEKMGRALGFVTAAMGLASPAGIAIGGMAAEAIGVASFSWLTALSARLSAWRSIFRKAFALSTILLLNNHVLLRICDGADPQLVFDVHAAGSAVPVAALPGAACSCAFGFPTASGAVHQKRWAWRNGVPAAFAGWMHLCANAKMPAKGVSCFVRVACRFLEGAMDGLVVWFTERIVASGGVVPAFIDYFAVVVGVVTGAMFACDRKLDIVGTVVCGLFTAYGGGVLRDFLLQDEGVYFMSHPYLFLLCVFLCVFVFLLPRSFPASSFDDFSVRHPFGRALCGCRRKQSVRLRERLYHVHCLGRHRRRGRRCHSRFVRRRGTGNLPVEQLLRRGGNRRFVHVCDYWSNSAPIRRALRFSALPSCWRCVI